MNLIDFRNNTLINHKLKISTRDTSKLGMINKLVLHCTDAEGWSPEKLSNFFVEEKGWPICGYHYYIFGKNVYHMVSDNVITYHAAPFNTHSLAFSLDYYATKYEKLNIGIDQDELDNASEIIAMKTIQYKIIPTKDSIVGHRELPFTGFTIKQDKKVLRKICPGLKIDLDKFRVEVIKQIQRNLGGLAIDGICGPRTINAIRNS